MIDHQDTSTADLCGAATEPHRKVRRTNPATSKLAAQRVPEVAASHHPQSLAALQRAGRRGMTVYEIAELCRIDAHPVGKRMSELDQLGHAEVLIGKDGKAATRKTPSGRSARVWVMKQKGGAA